MNNDIQIIGVDLAKEDSKDYSCVTSKCANCNSVIEIKLYEPYKNEIQHSIFKKCPICGTVFKKYITCN